MCGSGAKQDPELIDVCDEGELGKGERLERLKIQGC